MKTILKFFITIIIMILLWSIAMKIDSNRAEQNKLPIFAIDVVKNEYENGTITQYISIGYQVVHYELENKNNVTEFQNSFFVPDTKTLVDDYLVQKNGGETQTDEEAKKSEQESSETDGVKNAEEGNHNTQNITENELKQENKTNQTEENTVKEDGKYTVTHY